MKQAPASPPLKNDATITIAGDMMGCMVTPRELSGRWSNSTRVLRVWVALAETERFAL